MVELCPLEKIITTNKTVLVFIYFYFFRLRIRAKTISLQMLLGDLEILINYCHLHVRIKIYQEFYHCIVYIANEGYHIRIDDFQWE